MMSSPAIRLPQSNQQRGREQNALRTDAQPRGGQNAGWREGRQAIKRVSLARPVSLQPNLRLPRSAAIGEYRRQAARNHGARRPGSNAALQARSPPKQAPHPGGDPRAPARPCVCCCPTAAPAEASYSPKQGGAGCRMRSLQKRPRTDGSAGGMAQEVRTPMQLRILRSEPTHLLTEGGV
jgi:hypothetical protein